MPSSLTEVRSLTLGAFPLPTGVGLRYGQNNISLAAFLGGLGLRDFRPLAKTRPSRHALKTGSSLGLTLRAGSPSCPFDGFTLPTASPLRSVATRSGAGLSYLLSIAYDYNVLGLGPDSPWDDWRCPGTLRRSVWMVRTSITLLIPAFALVRAPPVLAVWLLRTHNAPLPMLARPRSFSRTSDGTKHSTASVRCLSLATLSVHAHSTSELLRTLSMMAASKPTSWLSLRTHSL